jgi:hypothetical protein
MLPVLSIHRIQLLHRNGLSGRGLLRVIKRRFRAEQIGSEIPQPAALLGRPQTSAAMCRHSGHHQEMSALAGHDRILAVVTLSVQTASLLIG